ncbi:ring finger protein dg17-related [Anaeramoeba flamelloides]|uniref:Ring finger protein dg17-related n=1 Tax=Anaeramoeba flamelloides TaxID=1746091 RepID=A0AAV8AG84_9EUKA|nr:ring finger protein dg17-related [Anaeramoeba flamelloides]
MHKPKYLYVSKQIKETLICPHCKNPFEDPVDSSCDHTFCRACFDHLIRNNKPCPKCNTPFISRECTESSNSVRQLLNKLQVYCPNKKQGCNEIFKRGEINKHRHNCGYNIVHCPNFPCDNSYFAKDAEKHLSKCVFRTIKCPFGCEKEIIFIDVDEHAKECVKANFRCKYCNELIVRDLEEQHFETKCTKYPQPCKYSSNGCNKILPRDEHEQHLKNCPYHQVRGLVFFSELSETMLKIFQKEIDLLKYDINQFEEVSSLVLTDKEFQLKKTTPLYKTLTKQKPNLSVNKSKAINDNTTNTNPNQTTITNNSLVNNNQEKEIHNKHETQGEKRIEIEIEIESEKEKEKETDTGIAKNKTDNTTKENQPSNLMNEKLKQQTRVRTKTRTTSNINPKSLESSPLLRLEDKLLFQICDYLDVQHLFRLACVCTRFIKLLKNSPMPFTNLNFSGKRFRQQRQLISVFQSIGDVRSINLTGALRNCGQMNIIDIVDIILKFPNLESLSLSKNFCSSLGEIMLKGLPNNHSLQHLDLSWNFMRNGVTHIAEILKTNNLLKSVNVTQNYAKDEGAIAFANVLKSNNRTLTSLNMSSNNIKKEGGEYLLEMLKVNNTLKHLILNSNSIGFDLELEIEKTLNNK